jgi:hypothetical protein
MSETSDQKALFAFVNRMAGLDDLGKPIPGVVGRYPDLRYCFHPANERINKGETIAAMLMGQRTGIWDILAPFRNRAPVFGYPIGSFAGLAIELKSKSGRLSPEQEAWRTFLRNEFWACEVYREWTVAARVLLLWVGGDPDEVQGLILS